MGAVTFPDFFTSSTFLSLVTPIGIAGTGFLMTGIAEGGFTTKRLLSLSTGLTLVAFGTNFSFLAATIVPRFVENTGTGTTALTQPDETDAVVTFAVLVVFTMVFLMGSLYFRTQEWSDGTKFVTSTTAGIFALVVVFFFWR